MTSPAPQGSLTLKYKLNSIGQLNSQNFGAGAATNTNASGGVNRRLPYYKITKLDPATNMPEIVVIVDGGENIVAGQPLVLNDSRTFDVITNTVPITEQQIVDNFCAFIIPQAANIGATDPRYTTRFQYMPTTLSLCNDMIFNGLNLNKEFKAFNEEKALSADFAKDIQLSLIPLDSTLANQNASVRFQIKGFQPTNLDYATEGELERAFIDNPSETEGMEQLFFEGNPSNWNGLGYTPLRTLTNWTTFLQNDADSRIKLTLKVHNYFEFQLSCQYYDVAAAAYAGDTLLLSTFETCNGFAGSTPYPQLKCFPKSRFYPLHVGLASVPGTNFPNLAASQSGNPIKVEESILVNYPKPINKLTGQKVRSYYRHNLSNITELSTIPSVFDYPADEAAIGGPTLSKPPLMIKFGNDIVEDNSVIASIAVNKLPTRDLAPINNQFISFPTGFASSYKSDTSNFTGTAITFEAATNINEFTSLGTFVVEIDNLPSLKGYITEAYTMTGIRVGNGGSLPIVGVVPFLEQRNTTTDDSYVTLRYSTPYKQPCQVSLPTEKFIYNFSFRLRNIETNKYLKNLLNPTELIFRIEPKM